MRGPCRAAALLSREPGGGLAFHPQPPRPGRVPSDHPRNSPWPASGPLPQTSPPPGLRRGLCILRLSLGKALAGEEGLGSSWRPGFGQNIWRGIGTPCFQPRPVPPCTSALSTPAGSGARGEGPARDPALHAPCTTVLGPLTDPLSPQSGVSVLQKGDSSFCRWLLPPLHPLRPHLKAWGAVWLPCGGRDLQATVPSHKDTAALPRTRQTSPHHRFHALLLCLVLTRGLGLPGTNGRTSGPCLRGSAPLLGL